MENIHGEYSKSKDQKQEIIFMFLVFYYIVNPYSAKGKNTKIVFLT